MSNTPSAPERSLAQRLEALDKANGIRSRRAELKRDLKAGRVGMTTLIGDDNCATMKVIDALVAMPKVGRVKAHRALATARISPSKTLGGLTSRQRRELLDLLPGGGGAHAVVPVALVAPIHSVPQPKLRGRRNRGLDDLLADIRDAR